MLVFFRRRIFPRLKKSLSLRISHHAKNWSNPILSKKIDVARKAKKLCFMTKNSLHWPAKLFTFMSRKSVLFRHPTVSSDPSFVEKALHRKNGVFVVWGRNRTHDGQIRRNILKLSLSSFLFAAMIQCCTTTTTYVCARVRVPFNLSKQRKKTWFRFNKRFSHMTSQFSRMTSRFSLVWRHGSPAWRHGSAGAKKVSIQTRWRK
jgi:hypothetical protein